MDYLEGLFLGKLWSDTDFENRRHINLFIIYGVLVDLLLLIGFYYNKFIMGIGKFGIIQLILFIALFIACPFINFKYYRMPWWGKLLVLVEKLIKAALVTSFSISLIIPRIPFGTDNIKDFFLNYLNSTLEKFTEMFANNSGAFSTVTGVLTGGIYLAVMFVLIFAALVIIPGLVYIGFSYLQYGYDYAIDKLIIRRYFRRRKVVSR